MTKDSDLNFACAPTADAASLNETSRLLLKLDQAIDHSTVLRDLIRRRELLHELENLTGNSLSTQTLRQEVTRIEQQLEATRDDADDSYAPVNPVGHLSSN
jgi:hypothetical protein